MEILFIHIYYFIIGYILYYLINKKLSNITEYKVSTIEIDLLKNNINCLKSLYISNRDVDANINLKILVEYYNKLKTHNQLSNEDMNSMHDKFLELKNLLLSLNNYRGIQSSIIEHVLNES
jgi:hypothetical protein